MKFSVRSLDGIAPFEARTMMARGVRSLAAVRRLADEPGELEEFAHVSGMAADRVRRWAIHADLMQLPGVATQYAALLEAGGYSTVASLASADADELLIRLREVNRVRPRPLRQIPGVDRVSAWIEAAATLTAADAHRSADDLTDE